MAKRQWRRLSSEDRREAIRLASKGLSLRQIAAAIGRGKSLVHVVLRPLGGAIRREMVEETAGRLSIEERVEIRLGLERGACFAQIARELGRHRSTVCREVNANGGRLRYAPIAAHRRAVKRAHRPKVTKLAANAVLCERVSEGLQASWSPQQIAASLRVESG